MEHIARARPSRSWLKGTIDTIAEETDQTLHNSSDLNSDLYPHVIFSGLLATNITRVENTPRLDQQHIALTVCEGFILLRYGRLLRFKLRSTMFSL